MIVSYNTLKKLIDFPHNPEELSALLTDTGLEVEGIHEVLPVQGGLKGLCIGEVKACERHPNADKLSCTKVDVGTENLLEIVCGAPNVAAGQKVIVATVGSTLFPTNGESFEIKKSKIRGEVSEGMLCAEDEIGLGTSHAGIMVLETSLPNGTPAATYFNLEPDYAIEIGLTPNRSDAASHFGVARDIRAKTGSEIRLPDVRNFKTGSVQNTIVLEVENTEACPRFCAVEIHGVEVKESPDWLKRFLATIDVNSINNLVDISNYICHFLGQPMHIYDADKLRGKRVIAAVPPKGTKIRTLDGIERELTGKDLAICDEEGPIGMAGVFGGEGSGVSNATKNVFLEVAYFNADWVRKTSTSHGLKTDASFRYERGTDPNMPPYAIKVAAQLVKDLAGGEICEHLLEIYPSEIANFEIEVKYKNIDRLLGKKLDRELIKSILRSLDILINDETDSTLQLSVPPYRVDVTREADIIEEILRIYGFQQIELSENLSSDFISGFPVVDKDGQRIRISEHLAANGFHEIQTLSIVKPQQNEALGVDMSTQVALLNPISEDLSVLRNSLLFSGLNALSYNINRRNRDLKFFEFGRSYQKTATEAGNRFTDKQVLGIWISGNSEAESWQLKTRSQNFFDLKNTLDKFCKAMKLVNLQIRESGERMFEYGLEYQLNTRTIISAGKVKATHLKYAGLKQEVFYAEIDWEYILRKYSPDSKFTEIPRFPEVRRDLSLVIDQSMQFDQIERVATQTERKLLKSVNIFDIYAGDKLAEGKKSYSVSFILQDEQKTLEDKQIDKTMNRLIDAFEKELSAEIRR